MAVGFSMNGMTLAQQLGQTLMIGFAGTSVPPEVADLIERHAVGGMILFARNIEDATQLLRLTGELQSLARAAGHRSPLLIAVDQENGAVRRVRRGVTAFPGNMALAAADSEQLVHDVAAASGRELRALGVTMNLAPVADVNNNPANPVIGVRSFGDDPERVARLVAAAVRGYRAAGIICCLKHFPGHGDTTVDSHLALPTLTHPLDRLDRVELAPFRAGIAAGADCVMLAHIAFPHLAASAAEADLPATISPAIVQGLLRERLGFDGVAVSDCMEMRAISETVGTERGIVLALRAGVDLVLVSHRLDRQVRGIAAVLEAVARGELSPDAIQRAAERVLRLKASALSWDDLPIAAVPDWIGGAEHARLAEEAYERSVTLVRDDDGLLPLRLSPQAQVLVLASERDGLTLAEGGAAPADVLLGCVRHRHPNAQGLALPLRPSPAQRDALLEEAAQADLALVATLDAHRYPEQTRCVQALARLGRPIVGIAVGAPYDPAALPELRTYLATYEYTPPAIEAAARVLFGEREPRGRLPVSLPGVAAQ